MTIQNTSVPGTPTVQPVDNKAAMNKKDARMDGTEDPSDAPDEAGQDSTITVSRRDRVRRCFIKPLQRDGLVRPKADTVEAHDAFLAKLADRLGYLDDALLTTLAEIVLGLAEGPRRNVWPSFAAIWNTAIRLRKPPDDERHIMTTWLASRAGPVAREAGHLVELHLWLRNHGCPPGDYAMKTISEEAAENARTRTRIAADVGRGSARPSDVDWLTGYLNHLAYCEALVAKGEQRRADQARDQEGRAA